MSGGDIWASLWMKCSLKFINKEGTDSCKHLSSSSYVKVATGCLTFSFTPATKDSVGKTETLTLQLYLVMQFLSLPVSFGV